MSDRVRLSDRIVNDPQLLGEAIEEFCSQTRVSYEGQTLIVSLQDALQKLVSPDAWALYTELESIANERSARLQEVIARWAYEEGKRSNNVV